MTEQKVGYCDICLRPYEEDSYGFPTICIVCWREFIETGQGHPSHDRDCVCMICAAAECPDNAFEHFWDDGCPACH